MEYMKHRYTGSTIVEHIDEFDKLDDWTLQEAMELEKEITEVIKIGAGS